MLASKSVAIPMSASRSDFVARLQRASGWHERNVIPDSLRAHGVDSVCVIIERDGRFRMELSGLENPYRPRMDIEGRGHLGPDSALLFEVGLKRSSLRWLAVITAVLLALAGYNLLVLDPPNRFAYVLFVFVPSLLGWCWFQVHDLTERAWPGLSAFVKRLLVDPVHVS